MAVCFTLVVGMIVMVWCTVPLFGLVVGSGTWERNGGEGAGECGIVD